MCTICYLSSHLDLRILINPAEFLTAIFFKSYKDTKENIFEGGEISRPYTGNGAFWFYRFQNRKSLKSHLKSFDKVKIKREKKKTIDDRSFFTLKKNILNPTNFFSLKRIIYLNSCKEINYFNQVNVFSKI